MAEKPKRVTQRIVRGEDGRVKILYIDLDTLQYVDDPFSQGYKVVTANTPIENVINIDEEDPQPNPENPVVTDPAEEAAIKESVQSAEGMRGSNSPTYSGSQSTGGSGYTAPSAPSQQGSSSGSERTAGVSGPSRGISSTQGVTTSNTARNMNVDKSANQPAGFVNNFANAEHRKGTPDQGFINSVTDIAGRTLGPGTTVTGYSGQGQYGSARHRDERGIAMDATISNSNHTIGKQAMEDVAMAYAAAHPNAGVGYDKNYMGVQNIHLDQFAQPGDIGKSWGAKDPRTNSFSRSMMDQNFAKNLDFARATGIGPTPTFDAPTPFGPNDPQSAPTATGAPKEGLQGLAASAIDSMGNQRAGTAANTSLDAASGIDMTANPGALASLGYTPRTEQDMADIGFALAGELGPYGLKTIGDENSLSKKELANMIATIENRAAATGKSIKDVLSPSQYNSLMEKNLEVTRANFTKYGDDIMAAVKDFYSPASFNNPANATHYANLSISNPGWAAGLLGDQKVGSHTFGRLSDEYSPSNTYSDVRTNSGLASYARDQINNQTSKGGYQPSLDRFSDMTDAVSRSNGESQGGRGRGGYSASSAEGSRSGSGSSGVSSRSEGGGLRSDSGGFSSGSSGYGPDMGRFDGVQGAVEASNSGGKSGSSDKGTSSYGGAKSSGDAQSSGKSGGKSSGGGFSSGRTSGKTDDN